MKWLRHFPWLALSVCAAFASLPQGATADQPKVETSSHAIYSVPKWIIQSARLPEPLVSTGITSLVEDQALSQALIIYEGRTKPDDLSSLATFLTTHPKSAWGPAVETNLGLLYLHYGYFSKSLDAFKAAWRDGKGAKDWKAKTLTDGAIGRLAWLEASLGRTDDLTTLLTEINRRAVTGSSTEFVQGAADTLRMAQKDPRHLYLCGPVALSALMLHEGARHEQVRFVHTYRATPRGTSLADVARLADQQKFAYHLVFRKPGESVPMPAMVHWKVGHFAAIIGERNGRYRVEDPIFPGQEIWVTPAALDEEASGYFLVSAKAANDKSWRTVAATEAAGIWGKGPTCCTLPGSPGPQDPPTPPNPPTCPGMCGYTIGQSTVSLTLSDTPVGYSPPIGPSTQTTINYNQREASQPQLFTFFNVGPKWTMNWLSYITDDPTNTGASVSRYIQGGGAYNYTDYNSSTGEFPAQNNDGSTLILVSQSPIKYQRRLQDGSIETYAQSDGSTSYPRNIFLSQVTDPQGNALNLNYDSHSRLTSVIDATGRETNFAYGLATNPLLVTQITDPFGRSAKFGYDRFGRLTSSTDTLGLTSSFTYDSNGLINSQATPYGTTNFAYTAPGTSGPPLFVDAEDPLGYHERVEWLEPAPISDSDPAATVPQAMPIPLTNQYLSYRDSFFWNKDQYVEAGCSVSGGCDYTLAKDIHFNHVPPNTDIKSTSIESVKNPLENRVWYVYPGQTNSIYAGTYEKPIATGRVLDDGSTQISQASYDPVSFNLTQTIDPLGRTTTYTYSNHIDLAAITQLSAYGVQQLIAQFTYNGQHRPVTYTDAAGETTLYRYNATGELVSSTNALGQKTQYQYNSTGDLTTIINANNATAASFTYDSYDRVATYTDSEGWIATYNYDNANRVMKIIYPDGTTDNYTYDKLDLASYQDREGRKWIYAHDANRRLIAVIDPSGQETQYGYNGQGQLTSLTDPKNDVTTWDYDIEGRLAAKKYADNGGRTYAYENTTSRLKSVTDALSQIKQFAYSEDDQLTAITYTNAVNPTPNVSFTYDPYFSRVSTMADGSGTTTYAYVPVGTFGALQPELEQPPAGNSPILYGYDELGRLIAKTVAGAGAETYQYDSIGRLNADTNDLGAFTMAYLGQTNQIITRQLMGSTFATTWSYLPNSADRRLAGIANIGLTSDQYSNYQFTTTPENFISSISESSDTASVYPSAFAQTASYNNLNQLTNLSGQPLTFDANGNLLSDGQRNYSWDAENRLIGITYPSQSGKATTFAYDGLSRRTLVSSTPPGGGPAATTSYIWCDSQVCQALSSSGVATREYYPEGEFIPGSPTESYYYGIDQIGSVRRAFSSSGSAPGFNYDAYGNSVQNPVFTTDFAYAGMFYNGDSGLYLTQYRAYDPVSGRWLSRDPIGETDEGESSSISIFEVLNGEREEQSLNHQSNLDVKALTPLMSISRWSNVGNLSRIWDVSENPSGLNGSNLYVYANDNPISWTDIGGTISGPFGNLMPCGYPDEPPPDIIPVNFWPRCFALLRLACKLLQPLPIEPSPNDMQPRNPITQPASPDQRKPNVIQK